MSGETGSEGFDELMADLDAAMLIATAAADGERAGCLVGFATQCSIDPPRSIVCLSEKNRTCRIARGTGTLAVHAVPDDAHGLAELFGGQTGDDVDKFERCGWSPGPAEVPILDACPAWYVATIIDSRSVGDHVAFVLEPTQVQRDSAVRPLRLSHAQRIDPGHEA